MSTQGGAKAQPNKQLKSQVYLAIFFGHYAVAKEFDKIPEDTDVTNWAAVTSYCSTAHKMSMQLANNGKGNIGGRKDLDENWTLDGASVKIGKIYDAWVHAMKLCKFDIVADPTAEWVGTMSSLLSLMAGFNRRANEIRVPPTTFKAKINGKIEDVSISSYGLDKKSLPFIEGITYAPHAKSAMVNSLGPLTIAIGLANCGKGIYADKWLKAFKRCWASLDFVDELAEEIRDSGMKTSHLMSMLATLCLFGVPRSNNKAFIPFVGLIAAMLKGNDSVGTFTASPTIDAVTLAKIKVSDHVNNMDSSGHGMWNVYHLMIEKKLTMMGMDGTGRELGQVFLHAVLGTHKDDLSLVDWMISKDDEMLTRADIGGKLKGAVGSKKPIVITKYAFNFVCKLSSSSGTSMLSGGAGQIQRHAVLSGKCTQEVTTEDAILACIQEAQTMAAYRARINVSEKLSNTIERLGKRIRKEQKIEWGTTDFYMYDSTKKGESYGDKCSGVPILKKKYFNRND